MAVAETAEAWLLNCGHQLQVAAGFYQLAAVLREPRLSSLPLAPHYCAQLAIWQSHPVPAMNLPAWFGLEDDTSFRYLAVLAYQQSPEMPPDYGGLLLTQPPDVITVSHRQASDLPEDDLPWQQIALSCFQFAGKQIPVLDVKALFAQRDENTASAN